MKVLISSTGEDLEDYRKAAVEVCRTWGHEPVFMENLTQFVPSKTSPEAACRDAVAQCQLVVVLVAYSYGTLVPGEDRSFTEFEYDTALSLDHVQLQGWLMHDEHPWPRSLMDHGEQLDRVERFRARVSSGHLTGFFGDLEKFKADLGVALQASVGQAGAPVSTMVLPPPVQAPDRCAVPAYIGSMEFIGRTKESAWLDAWVRSTDPVAIVDAIGGTGKSALTWAWWDDPAQELAGWSGRFWWSFYEPGNTLPEMVRAFLGYCGLPVDPEESDLTLAQRVLAELSSRPYLVVLDGVERLLDAYLRADAASFGEASLAELDAEDARRITDPNAYRFLEQLLGVRRSRILMSTRLVPDVYLTVGGRIRQGASVLQLHGLSDGDLLRLLARLEITGTARARDFFALLGNHPLLVKVVLGQVRDYRPAPGDFGAWLADPRAGGSFSLRSLTLTERSHHILAHSLDRLDRLERRLLQRLAIPYGPSDWRLVNALNPHQPSVGDIEWEGLPPWLARHVAERLRTTAVDDRPIAVRAEAERRLSESLERLEELGLLWWDRESNLYDIHPVVRAHVRDTLAPDDERRLHGLVADHFGFGAGTWDESAMDRITHDERIAVFLACVGAGWAQTAARLWAAGGWGRRLVWSDGNHTLAVVLLRALIDGQADNAGLTWFETDLAVAEERAGQVEAARQRLLRVLIQSVRETLDADSVCINLVNLSSAAYQCGDAALYEACVGTLDELEPFVPTPAARARPLLRAAIAAWERKDANGCLMAVQSALEVTPNPYDPEWEGTLERLRLASHADLGDWGAVGDVRIHEPRFGTTWFARQHWARFCWEVAIRRDDQHLALAAARELDLWRRHGGCESFRAEEAVALARMGRDADARTVVEDALPAITRVLPAQRPHLELAEALALLGDDRAEEQALAAYGQACARSTIKNERRDVQDAEVLLRQLGVIVPDRTTAAAPSSPVLPAEDLRAYIDAVKRGDIPVVGPRATRS